jgi:predicted NUDIX family NTP pyrophosphohydrolase
MAKQSAGILMFRRTGGRPEVLLVHPGGPFWAKKDDGAWSIPKGLYEERENPLAAARREFEEETGCVPDGEFLALGSFKQPSNKMIVAWAIESDFDLAKFKSNLFSME